MKHITESLRANDLNNLVKPVFQVDAYQSKIGNDTNIIVLSFTVDREEPAKDLENYDLQSCLKESQQKEKLILG